MNEVNTLSLSHEQTLKILHEQISQELKEFKSQHFNFNSILRSFLIKNQLKFIHNLMPLLICLLIFLASYNEIIPNIWNAIIIMIFTCFNLTCILLFYFKRTSIVYNKAKFVLTLIENCLKRSKKNADYELFDVNMPYSAAISSQLTIRNGKLINIPLNLIVKGDLILLKPGQVVYLKCKSVHKNKNSEYEIFEKGKVYEPNAKLNTSFSSLNNDFMDFIQTNNLNSPMQHKHPELVSYISFIDSCEFKKMPDAILCYALETPYLTYLKSVLYNYESESDSIMANEIFLVRRLILYFLIPAVMVVQLVVSLSYYFVFKESLMKNKFNKIVLINLSYVILPLLPISFTYFWKLTTLYGTVCFLKTLKTLKKILINSNLTGETELNESANKEKLFKSKIRKPTFEGSNENQVSFKSRSENLERSHYDENAKILTQSEANLNQDDLSQINDLSSIDSLLAAMPMSKKKINTESYFSKLRKNFLFYLKIIDIILFNRVSPDKILNDSDIQNASFIYFTNFLIGLGIITNFSCIDKKGVLSWPNPTAEKILLFKNVNTNNCDDIEYDHESQKEEDTLSQNVSPGDAKPCRDSNVNLENINEKKPISIVSTTVSSFNMNVSTESKANTEKNVLETYNLTHDNSNGSTLKFDDKNWSKNLNNLKPLGLSILLNTCKKELVNIYSKFTDFIKVESNKIAHQNQMENLFANNVNNSFSSNMSINEDNFELKAIIDRRCLCEISKIIGFDDTKALKSYEILGNNSFCRNLEIKSVSKVKPKQIRISNMFSVIASNLTNGMNNLYSQGSPDLTLDFCTSFWNGKQVCDLTKSQRKKLLDFYQRYSVSSYVTCFSYKPLIDEKTLFEIDLDQNSNHVIKCPSSYCEKLSSHSEFTDIIEYSNFLTDEESLHDNWDKKSVDESCLLSNTENTKSSHQNLNRFPKDETEKNKLQIENTLRLHSNQIFLGMISMQYRAKIDVIKLVEKLTKSCIRFIHFSSDNEQISRSFAEMLGLDAGWNCHISLGNDPITILSDPQFEMETRINTPRTLNNKFLYQKKLKSNLKLLFKRKRSQTLNKNGLQLSLPDLKFSKHKFNSEKCSFNEQIVKFDLSNLNQNKLGQAQNQGPNYRRKKLKRLSSTGSYISKDSVDSIDPRSNNNTAPFTNNSTSSKTNSLKTNKAFQPKILAAPKKKEDDENSSHFTIHSGRTLSETEILGNAAQLPKGIENIKHHLDTNIDNVPLHVSLFTDSSKQAITQMIVIMKQYGEIVGTFGSSHSIENNEIFATSNIAIGVDPLYPKQCIREACKYERPRSKSLVSLNVYMNTLCCGLNLKHQSICILPPLMSLAREMIHSYRIALIFMLMCNLSVCLVQLICNIIFLPPILSGFQVIFLTLFTIPLLSYSLIHKNESNDLRCSTKKNTNLINNQDIKGFAIRFFFKFFPSICILVVFHFLSLYFKCKIDTKAIKQSSNFSIAYSIAPKVYCHLFLFDIYNLNIQNSYDYWSNNESVLFSQLFNHIFLSIYFVFLSINFVCIEKNIWSYIPTRNKTWTNTVFIVLFIHLMYLFVKLYTMNNIKYYFNSIPIIYWIVTIIWPIILIIFNEFYKMFEIKEILRQYKKIRLDFDTKLGMNSPFV